MNAHPRSPLDSAALSGIPAWDTAWSFDPAPDAPTYRSLEPGLVAFWTDFLGEPPAALAPVAPDFARALALGIDDPAEAPPGCASPPAASWRPAPSGRPAPASATPTNASPPPPPTSPSSRPPAPHPPPPRPASTSASTPPHSPSTASASSNTRLLHDHPLPRGLCGQGTHPAPCPPPAVFQ